MTAVAPVVVGVDGSPRSLDAVAEAVRFAARHRRSVRVVHAFIWPLLHVPLGPSPAGPPEGGLQHDAERILAEAINRASATDAAVPVSGSIETGAAAPVLIRESRRASVVALGDRGLGGFTGLLIGSIAVQLAAHSACPLLVVRGTVRPDGPVMVGVDGSGDSVQAVGFAWAEAAARDTDLLAVHAWAAPVSTAPGDILPRVHDIGAVEDEESRLLSEALAGWSERYPEVTVRRLVTRGRPARILVEHSGEAQLVVVGARGRGGLAGLLLGSVSQALLHHSRCPVAVVRSRAQGQGAS
jgi:nucleotide-binding universal stress UspA family protein